MKKFVEFFHESSYLFTMNNGTFCVVEICYFSDAMSIETVTLFKTEIDVIDVEF